MGYIDMHIHSTNSDGRMTPEQIVQEAEKTGVSLISITDHDTYLKRDGWKSVSLAGKKVKLVPGAELSTDYYLDGKKVRIHLLAYDVIDKNGEFQKELDRMRSARESGNIEYAAGLIKTCSFLDPSIFNGFDFGQYGWIKKLIRSQIDFSGYSQSQQEQINRYLEEQKAVYQKCTLGIEQGIELVKATGGYTSFAHPHETKLGYDDLERIVRDLRDIGLDAVETFHAKATPNDNQIATILAQKFKLLESCGSDIHDGRQGNRIGYGKDGNMMISNASLASRLVEEGKVFEEGKYLGE